jgi:hypothetical protein
MMRAITSDPPSDRSPVDSPAEAPSLIDLERSFALDLEWPYPPRNLMSCSHFRQESLPSPATDPYRWPWDLPVLH